MDDEEIVKMTTEKIGNLIAELFGHLTVDEGARALLKCDERWGNSWGEMVREYLRMKKAG